MNQAYCMICKRAFSAEGAEIGLLIYNQEKGEWQLVCAIEECSGVPGSVTVDQLPNYNLEKEEDQDSKRLSKHLNEIEKSKVAMDQKASRSLTKFVEDLEES